MVHLSGSWRGCCGGGEDEGALALRLVAGAEILGREKLVGLGIEEVFAADGLARRVGVLG